MSCRVKRRGLTGIERLLELLTGVRTDPLPTPPHPTPPQISVIYSRHYCRYVRAHCDYASFPVGVFQFTFASVLYCTYTDRNTPTGSKQAEVSLWFAYAVTRRLVLFVCPDKVGYFVTPSNLEKAVKQGTLFISFLAVSQFFEIETKLFVLPPPEKAWKINIFSLKNTHTQYPVYLVYTVMKQKREERSERREKATLIIFSLLCV